MTRMMVRPVCPLGPLAMGAAARSRQGSTGGRLLVLAAVAATITGACGATTPGSPGPSSGRVATAPATALATDAPAGTAAPSPSVAALQVIDSSAAYLSTTTMLSGFGAVWAASDDGLLKVSATGTPDAVLTGTVPDIAVGARNVYAIVGDQANALVEVDPTSGRTLRRWAVAPAAKSVVTAGQVAYVAHAAYPMTIDRVDLKTGSLRSATIAAAADGLAGGQALAAGGGLVWATDGTTVLGLDPTDLSVRETVHPSLHVDDMWFGDGSLWVATSFYHGGVARIDPTTATQEARIATDAIEVAFSTHGVWLSTSDGPTEIDPTTGTVLATLPAGDAPGQDSAGIAVAGDEVWVDYKDEGVLQRIKVP